MKISLIAALTTNGAIGKGNSIPWRLPDDMKYFKQITLGKHVIMGRKNWESIPAKFRPLPDRINWVMTKDAPKFMIDNLPMPNTFVVGDLEFCLKSIAHDALCYFSSPAVEKSEVFIIGGGEIYSLALPLADRLYLTEIHATVDDCDVYFPKIKRDEWEEISRKSHPADEKHQYAFDFVIYEKIK